RAAGAAFVPVSGSGSEQAGARTPTPASQPKTRSLRGLALFIMALVPVSIGVWALSIVVPVVIEAREAMDEIFETPVAREHFDNVMPSPPALPTSATVVADPSP